MIVYWIWDCLVFVLSGIVGCEIGYVLGVISRKGEDIEEEEEEVEIKSVRRKLVIDNKKVYEKIIKEDNKVSVGEEVCFENMNEEEEVEEINRGMLNVINRIGSKSNMKIVKIDDSFNESFINRCIKIRNSGEKKIVLLYREGEDRGEYYKNKIKECLGSVEREKYVNKLKLYLRSMELLKYERNSDKRWDIKRNLCNYNDNEIREIILGIGWGNGEKWDMKYIIKKIKKMFI